MVLREFSIMWKPSKDLLIHFRISQNTQEKCRVSVLKTYEVLRRFLMSAWKSIFRPETRENTQSDPHVRKQRQPQTSWDLSDVKKISLHLLKGASNTSWCLAGGWRSICFSSLGGVKELQRDRNQSWLTLHTAADARSVENLLSRFSTGVSVSRRFESHVFSGEWRKTYCRFQMEKSSCLLCCFVFHHGGGALIRFGLTSFLLNTSWIRDLLLRDVGCFTECVLIKALLHQHVTAGITLQGSYVTQLRLTDM